MTVDLKVKRLNQPSHAANPQYEVYEDRVVPQPHLAHSSINDHEGVNMDKMLEQAVEMEIKHLGSLEECLQMI